MAFSRVVLSFVTIFVIIQLSWCTLSPMYDKDKGRKKFFDVGKHLEMSCKFTEDGNDPKDIKWVKEVVKEGKAKEYEEIPENLIKVEKNKSTLKYVKSEDKNDGTYVCKYQEEEHEFVAIANILVRIKPSTDVSVVEGETLILKCAGVGTQLRIEWEFSNNITDGISPKPYEEIANATLEIKNVDKSYRGNYTCVGTHDPSLGLDIRVESTAYVRVKDKYAALWPFILICIEVFILCAIILIYEKHRTHVEVEDSETEQDQKNGKN